ncbi:tryptophan synthase subunit alpha [Desulfomicrobium escambiense]|uniref:tryptophan synthase subunit alpha n=1 Tax=Desulfomicrobium escambiense TaxID=29503 RepID=UPI00042A4A5B|nr:tryptophan synthase subunit alpha [Desulfomicrobium escambiense]
MENRIDTALKGAHGIQLMTHVVAGYPSLEANEELIRLMAKRGVKLIEIQIPFTDPLADGPTIMRANQAALDSGITPKHCFELCEKLSRELDVAFMFMTYANIPFAMGLERFLDKAAASGASGVILPDLPWDEADGDYADMARERGLHPVMVISPDTEGPRLDAVLKRASGLVYTTLKVGITGAGAGMDQAGVDYVRGLKTRAGLPIAAGFGISRPEHVRMLDGLADAAVIGSHIINLMDDGGLAAVDEFLAACAKT